jgi:hypothetical protein
MSPNSVKVLGGGASIYIYKLTKKEEEEEREPPLGLGGSLPLAPMV